MTTSRFFNTALLFILCAPCPLMAKDALTPINPEPFLFKGIYHFELSGVPLGKLGIEVQQAPRHYSIVSDIMTTGVVKMFVKHSSHTTVDGFGNEDFVTTQATYESHYQTRGKKKYVKMITKNGVTGGEILVPADNPATRPPVAAQQKKNVFDPLTLTLRMREAVWRSLKTDVRQFSLPLYDGRRLTQVHFVVGDTKKILYKGAKTPVIEVTLSRTLVAGFTKKELDSFDPNEPKARFYFTDDKRFVPIRAEFTSFFGTASATLMKECAKEESCLFGITE